LKPLKVGITGGIGSGKSLVCRLFSHLGVPVYQADERAKQITATNQLVRSRVAQLLGSEALNEFGLNTKFVAQKVFNDKVLLNDLNAIIHPAVAADFSSWCDEHQNHPFLLKEAAILFETGSYKNMDKTILVTAPVDLRIQRVAKRDGANKEEVLQRIQNQWTDEQKIPLADFVIVNDGKSLLLPQVVGVYNKLKSTKH
jgi:dephospho-CoA kinase